MCHDLYTGWHWRHRWGKYSEPNMTQVAGGEAFGVVGSISGPLPTQRRECIYCGAVDFRIVPVLKP